jgi:hypothetical protein
MAKDFHPARLSNFRLLSQHHPLSTGMSFWVSVSGIEDFDELLLRIGEEVVSATSQP